MARNLIHIKCCMAILGSFFMLNIHNAIAQDSTHNSSAKIALDFVTQDSINQVKATVTNPDANGKDTAVKGADVHFFIKKSFGLLPIGDAVSTDDNGEALAEFPMDIPGDQSGNVTVIAKIEDNEQVGNLETSKVTNWAVPTKTDHGDPKRALWASADNAPIPLVVTVTSIVALVWGTIFYILFQLAAIKKAGKLENA
ncbi:hypothetical protein QTN47_13395 [Danxiaibacter flavus]|uniref:Uncharacterized protein n=1 Tax=Danxiaibacter flavus TaxID=3049108 RepID=A0ABV3ZF39_9BACT|nr:hypothetical protein QNM32_13400 [Chitinophagaceae bacterium DXS]